MGLENNSCLLLSGGIDSIAIAYWKKPTWAITINYGQLPAEAEINASAYICRELGINHKILHLPIKELGSGDLNGTPVSKFVGNDRTTEWWPFRNQMLITLGAQFAISQGIGTLLFGSVSNDCFFIDNTVPFMDTMSSLLSMQEGGMSLETPAIKMTSIDLVKISGIPPELLYAAHSCHISNEACTLCRGCYKYYETLDALGLLN